MLRRGCLWEKSTADSMINTHIFFPQNTFSVLPEHKPEAFSLAIPMPHKKARMFHIVFVYMENDQLVPVVHFPLPPWTHILAEVKSQTLLMSHENVKMMVKDGTLPRASTEKSHQNIIQNTVLKGQNFSDCSQKSICTKVFIAQNCINTAIL